MHRYIIIFLFIPFLSAKAATPFVSVAVQPTLTFVGYNWALSHEGGSNLGNYFYTYGGAVTTGLKRGQREFYVEYTWKNSREEFYRSSSTTEIEDSLYTTTSRGYRNRIKDQRLKLGVRFIVSESRLKNVRSFVGVGISAGTTKWSDLTSTSVYSRIITDTSYVELDHRDSKSERSRYSNYSFGGFFEIGSQFKLLDDLSLVWHGQFHAIVAQYYGERKGLIYENGYAEYYVEPLTSLALRWDFDK